MVSRLKYLTIKPNIYCTNDCPYCSSRQLLFKASKDVRLSVGDWATVIQDADKLGASYLDISGGEPTIYAGLPAVIWEAKKLGWFVSINTTGDGLHKLIDRLVEVHLDQVCISVMSLDEETHNQVRDSRDAWARMYRGVEAIAKSPIRLALHFILSRQNFREAPQMVDFAFDHGATSLAFIYPENDHLQRDILMDRTDIEEFNAAVVPVAKARYEQLKTHDEAFPLLFPADGEDSIDYSQGEYWQSPEVVHRACDKPDTFLLIYPNGSVLPCNGVEYTHSPIVGNVLETPLAQIWSGDDIERFRSDRIPYCIRCPIKRHCSIGIETTGNPPYYADVVKAVPTGLPTERPLAPVRVEIRRIVPLESRE